MRRTGHSEVGVCWKHEDCIGIIERGEFVYQRDVQFGCQVQSLKSLVRKFVFSKDPSEFFLLDSLRLQAKWSHEESSDELTTSRGLKIGISVRFTLGVFVSFCKPWSRTANRCIPTS